MSERHVVNATAIRQVMLPKARQRRRRRRLPREREFRFYRVRALETAGAIFTSDEL